MSINNITQFFLGNSKRNEANNSSTPQPQIVTIQQPIAGDPNKNREARNKFAELCSKMHRLKKN